jgi:hypothetical protein
MYTGNSQPPRRCAMNADPTRGKEGEIEFVRLERTQRLTRDMVMLLDLAISRSRAEGHADEDVKEQIHGALEAAKQEIVHLEELVEESERVADRGRRMRPRTNSEKEL